MWSSPSSGTSTFSALYIHLGRIPFIASPVEALEELLKRSAAEEPACLPSTVASGREPSLPSPESVTASGVLLLPAGTEQARASNRKM